MLKLSKNPDTIMSRIRFDRKAQLRVCITNWCYWCWCGVSRWWRCSRRLWRSVRTWRCPTAASSATVASTRSRTGTRRTGQVKIPFFITSCGSTFFGPPGSGSGSISLSLSKNSKKNLDFYCFVTSFWLFMFEMMYAEKLILKSYFLLASWRSMMKI